MKRGQDNAGPTYFPDGGSGMVNYGEEVGSVVASFTKFYHTQEIGKVGR